MKPSTLKLSLKVENRDAAVVTNAAGQTIKEVGLIDSETPFTYDVAWDPFGGIHGDRFPYGNL